MESDEYRQVEIIAAETVGVEKRAGYYESAGALRDMVPNHLAQLLRLIAMEPPVSFTRTICGQAGGGAAVDPADRGG